MKNMNNISNKKLVIALLAVFAIIILAAWLVPLQRTAGVRIGFSVGSSQGATENNTEMEIVKVHGEFFNEGDIIAKNLTATVIFTDDAHNKVVRKTVKEGVDLLPNKRLIVEFDSEYSREKTLPKTYVNVTVQFDYMENGIFKTTSDEPDSSDQGNNIIRE